MSYIHASICMQLKPHCLHMQGIRWQGEPCTRVERRAQHKSHHRTGVIIFVAVGTFLLFLLTMTVPQHAPIR